MTLQEEIIAKLTSSSFADYVEGIQLAGQKHEELQWDQELLERVLSVFVYHKAFEHDEVVAAYKDIGQDFPRLAETLLQREEVVENYFIQYQIKGLSLFLYRFTEGEMDTSGFLLPSGSSYQVAARACERVCTLADPKQWPVVRKGLAALYNVFDTLWKEQMTVSGILMNLTAWNDEAITALINIFNECDLESRGAILRGLHRRSDNLQIRTRIVEP